MKFRPNYSELWKNAISEAIASKHTKMYAILMNHADRKQYICNKLGIVSNVDIGRIITTFKRSSGVK